MPTGLGASLFMSLAPTCPVLPDDRRSRKLWPFLLHVGISLGPRGFVSVRALAAGCTLC